jgi:peroxiredoxin
MVVGVSSDDRITQRAFATGERLPFLLVADEDHAIARAFGVEGTDGRAGQAVFLIGRDGMVERTFSGIDPQELVPALGGPR